MMKMAKTEPPKGPELDFKDLQQLLATTTESQIMTVLGRDKGKGKWNPISKDKAKLKKSLDEFEKDIKEWEANVKDPSKVIYWQTEIDVTTLQRILEHLVLLEIVTDNEKEDFSTLLVTSVKAEYDMHIAYFRGFLTRHPEFAAYQENIDSRHKPFAWQGVSWTVIRLISSMMIRIGKDKECYAILGNLMRDKDFVRNLNDFMSDIKTNGLNPKSPIAQSLIKIQMQELKYLLDTMFWVFQRFLYTYSGGP
jgi:hypothetical protein